MLPTMEWRGWDIALLDQRLLPGRVEYRILKNTSRLIWALESMVIRGAPAIGVAGAMGLAQGAARIRAKTRPAWDRSFQALARRLEAARPTAVNLAWAVRRLEKLAGSRPDLEPAALAGLLREESIRMQEEDIAANRALGRVGAEFLPDRATVLTHCNTGALATCGFGTALGVVRAAVEAGKEIRVIADETRPFLQGARLTAWELRQDNIPVEVAPDSMAASLMAQGRIDAVLVGADRIAANGDVANKIGTYQVALGARAHKVPFYVAAPLSTIDPDCPNGAAIPLELRPAEEVSHCLGRRIVPQGVGVLNQAFDLTPARYVDALFTEAGAAAPLNRRSLAALRHQSA